MIFNFIHLDFRLYACINVKRAILTGHLRLKIKIFELFFF